MLNRSRPILTLILLLCLTCSLTSSAHARDRFLPKEGTPLIRLQVGRHERALFGWKPAFMLNVPNFDVNNVPYIRSRQDSQEPTGYVQTLVDGKWIDRGFAEAVKAAVPGFTTFRRGGGWIGTRIVFDKDNHCYTAVKARTGKSVANLLLFSTDQCRTWQVLKLPAGTAVLEKSSTVRPLEGPPAILVWKQRAKHAARFCSWNVLSVIIPRKTPKGLVLGKPVEITQDCFGYCMHSGGATFATTHNGKTHIVWGEAVAEKTTLKGVPTYAATLDHATGKLGKKVLMGHAPPVNDVHNAPGIVRDSEGVLHVVTGAHGANFYYLRSKKPDDVYGGWTQPEATLHTGWVDKDPKRGERGRQTYLALVCDADDTLHIAFRQWRAGKDKHLGGRYYAALSTQRKQKGKPWEDAKALVGGPVSAYGIWYHKLALDRRGNLYLSYSYYTHKHEPYKTELVKGKKLYKYRAMLTSRDGGTTWDLATTEDFQSATDDRPLHK